MDCCIICKRSEFLQKQSQKGQIFYPVSPTYSAGHTSSDPDLGLPLTQLTCESKRPAGASAAPSLAATIEPVATHSSTWMPPPSRQGRDRQNAGVVAEPPR